MEDVQEKEQLAKIGSTTDQENKRLLEVEKGFTRKNLMRSCRNIDKADR
jgi:hypothetical protein